MQDDPHVELRAEEEMKPQDMDGAENVGMEASYASRKRPRRHRRMGSRRHRRHRCGSSTA